MDWYASEAQKAMDLHAFESAVRLYTEAAAAYPSEPRFNVSLGSLYYSEELWTLALGEYRTARDKGADDRDTLTRIARCYGKLNQERDSITWTERALEKAPADPELTEDLAWLFFKTHQLAKAEQSLEDAVARHGMTPDFAMTLGTVYAGMSDYDRSYDNYRKAIEGAAKVGDRTFASIAWYNLSLLERKYFRYNSALADTEESLSSQDRPSGHLARGELLESSMDVKAALGEYESALARDDTPLTKVNLAVLHQTVGHLELARRYAEEALGATDLAWLMYYGTDLARYRADIHEALADIDAGLARTSLRRPTAGPIDRIRALGEAALHALTGWYNRSRFRMLSVEVGRSFLAEGAGEDGAWFLARGSEAHPAVALKYLEQARAIETAHSPHAAAFYLLEEGRLTRSPQLLREAIDAFDPFWEREPMAEALALLAPLASGPGNAALRRDTLVRLYAINPGALPQAGLGLPLALELRGPWSGREKRVVTRLLRRSGSEVATPGRAGFRHLLAIERTADGYRFALTDTAADRTVASGTAAASGGLLVRSARLVQAILAEAYAVQ